MPPQQPQLQPPVQVECTNFTYKGLKNASGRETSLREVSQFYSPKGELYCFAVIFG